MKNIRLLNNYILSSSSFRYLFAFITLLLIAKISFSQEFCGQGQMVELKSTESITIDGYANEVAWSKIIPNPISTLIVGQSQSGYAAQWKGLWDTSYLYIFVQVTDPTIYPGNGPMPTFYQFDAVEIFIDANNTKVYDNYDTGDHQYGFSYGTSNNTINPTGVNQGGTNKTLGVTGINYGRVRTATGYNMEIEIPWILIGGGISPTPAVGVDKLIGFDIAIDDDNNGGVRNAQYSWFTSSSNEYGNASAFATVPLVDCSTGAVCPNAINSFLAITPAPVIPGITYQWQVDSGSGFVNITDNTIYSGAQTDTLLIINPPTSMYGYVYRNAVTEDSVINYSPSDPLLFVETWTGNGGTTTWENTSNWSCGVLPDSNTDVIINNGAVVLSSNASVRSLTVSPKASFTIVSPYKLTVTH